MLCLFVYDCIHCLEDEPIFGGADMCLEPLAETGLSVNSYEWESPDLVSVDNSSFNSPLALEQPCLSVQGRLNDHSDFWLTELGPSSFVEGITKGYQLPFYKVA